MDQADSVHSTPPTNTPEITSTRRHLLTGAAGVAIAAAISTSASIAAPAVDPVFDLINLHKRAQAAHLAAIDEANRLEKMHGVHLADRGSITEKPCHDENAAFEAQPP